MLGDVCTGCESIPGAGPDRDPGGDRLTSGNGVDTMWGDEGNDSPASGNGDDRLFGDNPGGDGDQTDSCDGGRGADIAARGDTTTNIP